MSLAITRSIEVGVPPARAFEAFTVEMPLWFVKHPHSFSGPREGLGLRFEPGLGGRIVEIWDEATGEGYDTGRITAWDPGRRFAFEYRSAYLPPEPLTEVEVRFEPIAAGTRVTLEHRGFEKLPPKLFEDWKGRAWKLLVQWFAAWCARR